MGGSQTIFDQQVEKPTIKFWRERGGVAEVVRDVANACSQFNYVADVRMCLPDGKNYVSLAPSESESWRKTSEMLSTLAKIRETGNADLEVELEEGQKQALYYRSLVNTIVDILLTQKGAAILQNDDTFSNRAAIDADFRDANEIKGHIEAQLVFGEEMWLDLLVTALEEEDAGFVNHLFCKDAPQAKSEKVGDRMLTKLREPLYRGAEKVLQLFELKAKSAYYGRLNDEAKMRQDLLAEQNQILNDYARCLEGHIKKSQAELRQMEITKGRLLEQFSSFV